MKRQSFGIGVLSTIIVLVTLGAIYYHSVQNDKTQRPVPNSSQPASANKITEDITSQDSSSSRTPTTNNLVRFESTHIGSNIQGFTVESIKPSNKDFEISPKNFIVEFSGKAILSGKYSINDKKEFYTQIVALFEPDTASSSKLPYICKDKYLEFSNNEKAVELLSPYGKSGNVTIEIDSYTLLSYSRFDFAIKRS